MCGIAVLIEYRNAPALPANWPFWGKPPARAASVPSNTEIIPTFDELIAVLQRRGPDKTNEYEIEVNDTTKIQAISTILSLRSSESTTELKENETDRKNNEDLVILYNGEIYGYDENELAENECDTKYIRNLIHDTIFSSEGKEEEEEEDEGERLLKRLDKLKGPWSLIFWSAITKRLYFARDQIGRRSLLISAVQNSHVIITSTPPKHVCHTFVEIPPLGLAYIDFSSTNQSLFHVVRRSCISVEPERLIGRKEKFGQDTIVAGSQSNMYVSFLPRKWLRNINDNKNGFVETETDIVTPGKQYAAEFVEVLTKSVRRRLSISSKLSYQSTKKCICALLFSGGIDSMVLAKLLYNELSSNEPLVLINIAFGNDHLSISQCPDRLSSISGYEELLEHSMGTTTMIEKRPIMLICIDVNKEEAKSTLNHSIKSLVYPCSQPMDATIGTAIWLAVRGNGYIYNNDTNSTMNTEYDVPDMMQNIKVIFSGLGADELMAGYKGRHRTVFKNEGVHGIQKEMNADLSRLWFRNLGRDDRLISDHGKEVRQPFLDEDVIDFVTQLALVPHVCDLSLDDGIGDKALLRQAGSLLGLSKDTTTRAKRAIQFGSRSKQVIEKKDP